MTPPTPVSLRSRVHRATCELDARGEIDAHAAMCLRQAIDAARARKARVVLVDLRDLTAITPVGLALLRAHTADCHAHGMDLGLLISSLEHHDPIAEALVSAGLGDQLHPTREPPLHTWPARPRGGARTGGAGSRGARPSGRRGRSHRATAPLGELGPVELGQRAGGRAPLAIHLLAQLVGELRRVGRLAQRRG